MNTRRLLFLSALCLTMGTTQVSAQSFLKKIKNKGTQMIKEAAPKPVKEVMDAVDNANKAPKNKTTPVLTDRATEPPRAAAHSEHVPTPTAARQPETKPISSRHTRRSPSSSTKDSA